MMRKVLFVFVTFLGTPDWSTENSNQLEILCEKKFKITKHM